MDWCIEPDNGPKRPIDMFKYEKSGESTHKKRVPMNKRGVSPLVATLILIMFSIALGALVMNWGKAYIEERAEFVTGAKASPLSCDNIELDVIKVGGVTQACVNAAKGTLRLDLENGVGSAIDNIQLRIVGSQSVINVDKLLPSQMAKGESKTVEYPYLSAGEARQAKLTPYMLINGQPRMCTTKAIVIDGPIRPC